MPTFETSDGLRLHYTDTGAEKPLVCLPGLTRTGADFRYVAPYLDGCRILTLDMRGRGQSDFDPDWPNYNLQVECRDILEWLDHLGLAKVAVLGTSRGGLQAMALAAGAKHRLLGVALNDVGPELDPQGLEAIMTYLGHQPKARDHEEAARALAATYSGFNDVPHARWLEEAQTHFVETETGLEITYDPKLREAVLASGPIPDLWPLFDALDGLPLCALRGAGSNLLSPETFANMQSRRPDMIAAEIPGRGHVPFLDEPESVSALRRWLELLP